MFQAIIIAYLSYRSNAAFVERYGAQTRAGLESGLKDQEYKGLGVQSWLTSSAPFVHAWRMASADAPVWLLLGRG